MNTDRVLYLVAYQQWQDALRRRDFANADYWRSILVKLREEVA